MNTSRGLYLMMVEDTGADIGEEEFKRAMVEEGYEPSDWNAKEWEFRISPANLRKRKKSKVCGWMASASSSYITRRA